MKRRIVLLLVVLSVIMAGAGAALAQGDNQSFGPTEGCGNIGALPRLISGQAAIVTPGLPNLMRTLPGTGWNSTVVGQIPAGSIFAVVGGQGPQCANGMYWWLANYNGVTVWTPEGDAWGNHWADPYIQGCLNVLYPRLAVTRQGRVTPGLPNTLRSQPFTGSGSTVLGYIPAGATFMVFDGPKCNNNMNWWYVSYNGVNGWTPEGQNGVYWLEPLGTNTPPPPPSCAPTIPTRLSAGRWGRVTPGLPNTLRADATTNSTRIGQIPAGGSFYIIEGPRCANGMNWWRVNYNGVIGWTGEGQTWYWLEPA